MRREPEPTPEDVEAYERDMAVAPPDLPTAAEIDAMFAALGEPDPFRG